MAQQDKTWESAWRSALENKSMAPPADIWDNVSAELDKPAKRNMLPIWWAAAVISVCAVSGLLYLEKYGSSNNEPEQIGLVEEDADEVLYKGEKKTTEPGNGTDNTLSADVGPDEPQKKEATIHSTTNAGTITASVDVSVADPDELASEKKEAFTVLPTLVNKLKATFEEIDLPAIPQLWGVPMALSTKAKNDQTIFFAGLNLSAGSANVNNGSGSSDPANFSTNGGPLYNTSSSASNALSYGVNVGAQLSSKIVVESGVNYMRLANTGTSNIGYASGDVRSVYNESAQFADIALVSTSPYELQNIHQFLSVPVKAGYVIFDDKVKLTVLGGVSGDYFIKTSTEDLSGNLEKYEASPGEDAQWNGFTWNVLGEINLSHTIGQHYNFSIRPQVKRSLSDFSNTSQELKPLIFQVGVGFSYQF